MIIRSDVKRVPEFTGAMIPQEWTKALPQYQKEWIHYKYFHPSIQKILTRSPRIPSQSDEWKQVRQTKITATNTAALISETSMKGKSPWSNRYKLFLCKTGRLEDSFSPLGRKAMQHGLHYEAEAAQRYSEVTGIDLVNEDIGMITHPEEEHIAATPDRLAKYLPINIEIKCPYWVWLGRKKLLHEIPDHYYAQVQHQMAVLGLAETHFVQYVPPSASGDRPAMIDIVRVPFDAEWWDQAHAEIQKFYVQLKEHTIKTNSLSAHENENENEKGNESEGILLERSNESQNRKRKRSPLRSMRNRI